MLPSRSNGNRLRLTANRPVRRDYSGDESLEPADGAPILDGAKSALLTVRSSGPDLPLVLADWFLERASTGDVWLWTGTFDPDRLRSTPGRVVRDRVGHRGAAQALTEWHRTLTGYAPGASVLVGVEAHKSGARHAHAAIVAEDLRFEWPAREWYRLHGYNVFERADRATAAARYAAKYVGKELGVWDAAFHGRDLRL